MFRIRHKWIAATEIHATYPNVITKALPTSVFISSRRSKRICTSSFSCRQLNGSEWQQVLRSSRNFSSSSAYAFHHCSSQTCSNKIALREANRERNSSLFRSDVMVPVVTCCSFMSQCFPLFVFASGNNAFSFPKSISFSMDSIVLQNKIPAQDASISSKLYRSLIIANSSCSKMLLVSLC